MFDRRRVPLVLLLVASCLPILSGCRHVSPSYGAWTVVVHGGPTAGPMAYDFGDGPSVPAFPGLVQDLMTRYGEHVGHWLLSPDGRRLAFTVPDPTPPTAERPLPRDLAYVVDVAGPPWDVVPLPEDATVLAWSADGRHLACSESAWCPWTSTWSGQLLFIDVVSRQVVRWESAVSLPVSSIPGRIAFSPDGAKLAYGTGGSGIALLEVATGRVDTVALPGSSSPEPVTWLPDGRMAYWDLKGGGVLLGRPGEEAFTVLTSDPDNGVPLSCRPDGGAVIYSIPRYGGAGCFGMSRFLSLPVYVTFTLRVRYPDGRSEELDFPAGPPPDEAVWLPVRATLLDGHGGAAAR